LKINPCPFCASTNIKLMDLAGWEIWCDDCGGMGGATDHETGCAYASSDKCVTNWNRRAQPEDLGYERVAQRKTFELMFSVIDSWNDLVDGDDFKSMIEGFTTKMEPILDEYFVAKFPEHAARMAARKTAE
jgi:hypothetical protein